MRIGVIGRFEILRSAAERLMAAGHEIALMLRGEAQHRLF